MKKRILTVLLTTLAFLPVAIAQQTASVDSLTRQIDSILAADFKPGEPGAVALVARNGQPIFRKAYGLANLEFEVPMKPENSLLLGSVTKQFTAVGILILHEQGKLSIKDDIRKYVPEFNTHGETVTIEHLLTMTGGIPGGLEMNGFNLYYAADTDEYAELNFIQGKPLLFKPGTNWSYSNPSYALAGLIIERVSKTKYKDFIRKNIFEALDMKHTYYASNQVVKNQATGYRRTAKGFELDYEPDIWPTATFAGAIVSTVDDMLKWNEGLKAGKLIQPALLNQAHSSFIMQDGVKANYGYGWSIRELGGEKTISHGGNIPGFNAQAMYLPGPDIYVVVLNNQASNKATLANQKIVNLLLGIPPASPVANKDLKINHADFIGTYESPFAGARLQTNFTTTPRYFTVVEDKGALFIKRTAISKMEVVPVSETSFAIKNNPTILFKFVKDKEGKITGLIPPDERRPSKKISNEIPVAPAVKATDSVQVLPYTGIYKLSNANNRDYFIQKEGKLWLKESKEANPQELAYIGNDSFTLKSDHERIFRFIRDKKGKVVKVEQQTTTYDLSFERYDPVIQ